MNSRNQKYRERKRKVCSLEEIVQSLSSPQKNKVKEVFVEDSKSFQSSLANGTIYYLKSLWKKGSYPEFHNILFEFFADILEDDYFMKQLAKSLDIRPYHLLGSLNKYKSSNFSERRGRHKFKERQLVYDMWIDYSMPSADGPSGTNIITISKHCFLPFTDSNQKVLIEEKVNKRGQVFQGTRMIAISTVCGIQ